MRKNGGRPGVWNPGRPLLSRIRTATHSLGMGPSPNHGRPHPNRRARGGEEGASPGSGARKGRGRSLPQVDVGGTARTDCASGCGGRSARLACPATICVQKTCRGWAGGHLVRGGLGAGRPGWARHGMARRARQGKARQGAGWRGEAWLGGRGMGWQGSVRRGWLGTAATKTSLLPSFPDPKSAGGCGSVHSADPIVIAM